VKPTRLSIALAIVLLSAFSGLALGGPVPVKAIRKALATKLKVEPSAVRFRSFPMGIFESSRPAGKGQRRFVKWRAAGKTGTAEVGLVAGAEPRLEAVRRGDPDAKAVLHALGSQFGAEPDLHHALRGSGMVTREAFWSRSRPGPSGIMKRVTTQPGLRHSIVRELRTSGGQLVGYAADLSLPENRGLRVFYNVAGRQVSQHRFTPEQ
jgi:hypothetical protein